MTEIESRDHHFLALAAAQACQAASIGNAPIGAVLTSTAGTLLAQNHNRVVTDDGLLYHAEMMILLENQSLFLTHRWTTTLYTTLDPCLMCLSTAIVHHVKRIVWLVNDYWAGGTRCLHGQATYLQQNQCELVHRSVPELEHKVISKLVAFYAQKWPAARVAMMLGAQLEQTKLQYTFNGGQDGE